MTLMTELGLAAAAGLAFANGANDISKSIATLVGSGESSYRKAVVLTALATATGAVLSSAWAVKMTLLFTHGMLSPQVQINQLFAMAVLGGAILWVALASRFGWPVSTTHAIVGSVILTGVYTFGFDSVFWASVTKKVIVPLLLSPLVAYGLSILLFRGLNWLCREKYCLNCHWSHWMSAMASGFARGLNDTPKIAALGLTFYYLIDPAAVVAPRWFFLVLAVAMAAGAITMGYKTTETLAVKVTEMDHLEGFAANLATSLLVVAGATQGWPMSTTHVAGGGIMGIGVKKGRGSVRWGTVGEIALAWVVTLPAAGGLGVTVYWLMRRCM
ncbi:MAG: inorganic phosphate transporter [Elusimicrobia bacterium]|nr:inorganic phosphate transporter [Elusimicrobiota bacterium]